MYDPTWDLDVIFPGGSKSKEFYTYLQTLEGALDELGKLVQVFNPNEHHTLSEDLIKIVTQLESTMKKQREAFAFISCLSAQNVHDRQADLLVGRRNELNARLGSIKTKFDQKLVMINDTEWENLLDIQSIAEVSYVLNEYRIQAQEKLSVEQEVLMNDLAIDGYQGWSQMYDTIVGQMQIDIEEDGKVNSYSVGQASNKLSSPDRKVRKHVFEELDKAWTSQSELFGQTLNHLAGFRLQMYKHRGWDNVLKEPLSMNRMSEKTLDVMWSTIVDNIQPFVNFLKKKAELLGLDQLSMYDIGAPVSKSIQTYTYSEGAQFIINHFREFSPKMADFAEHAFEKRWIEAEDRPGKRPGGFCTSFPDSEQTRIFMTYSGTASNIATLAHELGHAYHQHVMNDVNGLNQRYAMNVAETASTFAEMIVADAAVNNAETKEDKIALLEDKIKRSVAFFMNIHARFLFEQRFYEERKNGLVPVKRLNELMVEAQKEAYCDAVTDYDETFWASKLHFHITGVPFYNFPYTFGYLFSLGLYAHAKQQDEGFEEDYIALLRDTGQMSVEQLAMKHLGIDLTTPDFWEDAIQVCREDVDEFLSLI